MLLLTPIQTGFGLRTLTFRGTIFAARLLVGHCCPPRSPASSLSPFLFTMTIEKVTLEEGGCMIRFYKIVLSWNYFDLLSVSKACSHISCCKSYMSFPLFSPPFLCFLYSSLNLKSMVLGVCSEFVLIQVQLAFLHT